MYIYIQLFSLRLNNNSFRSGKYSKLATGAFGQPTASTFGQPQQNNSLFGKPFGAAPPTSTAGFGFGQPGNFHFYATNNRTVLL